jgi:hypothetical protein
MLTTDLSNYGQVTNPARIQEPEFTLATKDISIHQQQLARVMPFGNFSVREDVLFSNHKGDERSGIRKRNSKALERLRPALERVLQPGEAVLYIARGRTPLSVLEQLTAGWWTHMLAAAAVVFTNQRILFLSRQE